MNITTQIQKASAISKRKQENGNDDYFDIKYDFNSRLKLKKKKPVLRIARIKIHFL